MPEVQYSSLDDTVSSAFDVDSKPTAAAIARRSISIFSRRGTGTPEHETNCIDQAAMSRTPTKNVGERRHTWLRRKSLYAGVSQEFPKGTILKAVPPTERLRMTRLEEEMATSPNEEIISAISVHPPTTPLWHNDYDKNTFTPAVLPNTPHTSSGGYNDPIHQTDSVKRRETNDRIGVWVHGITHWDENPSHFTPSQDLRFKRHSITESRRLEQQMRNRIRPTLTVAIPGVPPLPAYASAVNAAEISCQPSPVPAALGNEGRQPTIQVRDQLSEDGSAAYARPAHAHHKVLSMTPGVGHRCSSSSTGSSAANLSDASINSKRSSATSAEAAEDDASGARDTQYPEFRQRHAPQAKCAVDDDASLDINKPLPRVPVPNTMRTAPALPPSTLGRPLRRDVRIASAPGSRRINRHTKNLSAPRMASSSQSLHSLDFIDAEFMRVSPYAPSPSDSAYSEADSPTLSQAEHDLQAQLGSISELMNNENAAPNHLVGEFVHGDHRRCDVVDGEDHLEASATDSAIIKRADSVRSVMQPPARAPTLPKRSRKREWRKTASIVPSPTQGLRLPPKAPGRRKSESALASFPSTQQHETESLNRIRRSESTTAFNGSVARPRRSIAAQDWIFDVMAAAEPELQVPLHSDEEGGSQYQSASWLPAEKVLIGILSSLTSTKDLFNMVMINKGMYRVFKENELDLVGTVSRNQSPAGWELREWRSSDCEDDSPTTQLGHTTQSYLSSKRHDETVVHELMKLVLKHCQTFIRRETALTFTHSYHPKAQRFIDAFWRIWTFCTIFGSQKGREEDITGQLDWLKGGLVANNQSFSATVNTNLEFDMGSVLLNAPDHFAKGNNGGLSAAQLYDMMELWNCLRALLTGYQGHTEEARLHHIFSNRDFEDSDIDEEQMLEEWIAYVLTLGPEVVLQLAKHATDDPSAGFALAEARGWTDWALSETGTRTTFLKEPVSRLYEERIMNAAMRMQNPDELEKKENARKRVAALAAEIRLRRQSSGYKRLPVIDMRNERAMSTVSRHSSATPTRSTQMIQTSGLPLAVRYYGSATQSARPFPPSSRDNLVSPLSYPSVAASARSSPTSQWSSRHISPIVEDRVEAFNRLSLANLDGNADSTAERAVQKITEMGFTEAQAKHALRMTDMGDGLRVDRAVDMLLRT